MILLESSRFLMGSEAADSIANDGEGPVRPVTLDRFYLDRYSVTNARFREFIAATGYRTEAERFGWSFVFKSNLPSDAGALEIPGLRWWRRVDGAG